MALWIVFLRRYASFNKINARDYMLFLDWDFFGRPLFFGSFVSVYAHRLLFSVRVMNCKYVVQCYTSLMVWGVLVFKVSDYALNVVWTWALVFLKSYFALDLLFYRNVGFEWVLVWIWLCSDIAIYWIGNHDDFGVVNWILILLSILDRW